MEKNHGEEIALAYSFDGISINVKEDGTQCYVTLRSKETEDRGFRTDLEGLSTLFISLQSACCEMVKLLKNSGKSSELLGQTTTEPMVALSIELGIFKDGRGESLRIQTEDGLIINIVVPYDICEKLAIPVTH